MNENFPESLRRVLQHEGGYSNNPNDPGGPTNFGITINDVRKYVKKDATAHDVRDLSLATAKQIYKSKYWDVMSCDDLPSGVDYAVFDYGVNSGTARSLAVYNRFKTERPEDLVESICDERLRFLRSLKTWPTFGGGWGRRVSEVKAYGLKLAQAAPPPPPDIPAPEPEPIPVPQSWISRKWKQVTGWLSGFAGAGFLGISDWKILVAMLAFVLLVGLIFLFFIGPSRARDWFWKHVT